VINLSDVPKEDAAYSALGKGPKYAVASAVLPIEDFLSDAEKAVGFPPEEDAEEGQQETVRILKASTKPKDNMSGAERRRLRALRTNADVTVLPANKGNTVVVVVNTGEYRQKVTALLDAPTYRRLPKDPTETVKRRTTIVLKKSSFTEVMQRMRTQGSRPPRMYWLPNNQKDSAPTFRPVVCTIGLTTRRMAQYLLGEHVRHTRQHERNSPQFGNIL
jgi:hypothetical protein